MSLVVVGLLLTCALVIWTALVDYRIACSHLREVGESYFTHMGISLRLCLLAMSAGFVFLIHSFAPCTFKTTGSGLIARINSLIELRR